MSKLLRIYTTLLKNHFMLVQSAQAGLMMSLGDIIAQVNEKKSLEKVDLVRTRNFLTLGVGIVGPSSSMWYKILARTFGETGSTAAIKKVAVDQLMYAPVFLAIFIAALNSLEGHSWEYTKNELDQKYFNLLMNNYKLWPAVQLVNFYLVPLNYQILFVQGVALFWNAFLSTKLKGEVKKNDQ